MRRISYCVLGLLLIAGCDIAGEDPASPPVVRVTEPLPDLTFTFYDSIDFAAGEVVMLRDHFEVVPPNAAIMFEATAEGATTVKLDTTLLRVSPVDVGEGTVVVRARAEDGATVADTFTVQVSTECPLGPGPGKVDFLPLIEGEAWRFRYSSRTNRSAGEYTERKGTLTLSLGSIECAGETRRVQTEEHREGIRINSYRALTPSGWRNIKDTTEFTEERALEIVETEEGVQLPWEEMDAIARYHPASTDTVRVERRAYDGDVTVTLIPRGLFKLQYQGVPHTYGRYSYQFVRSW